MSVARLFVALDLPDDVCRAAARCGAQAARADPALRALPAPSLHLTLCFLGDRPVDDIPAIGAAATERARPVRGLSFAAEALWLPPRRPRVLALAVVDPDGELAALRADVAAALRAMGAFEDERRRFLPHLTVARVGRGGRASRAPVVVPACAFQGTSVTLYRSRLSPGGADYEGLATVRL